MLQNLKNLLLSRYRNHPEAVIIACYYNPEQNPYRLKAFNRFYASIKHLNYRIIECVIGNTKPELPENEFIQRVYTQDLLWHKEALLNKLVKELPKQFKFCFWLDTDIYFTNKNWLVESVKQMKKGIRILQPFDIAVHLEKDEVLPHFSLDELDHYWDVHNIEKTTWRSFCATYSRDKYLAKDKVYDRHGFVGFAWGARREVLEECPLYDRALIGGADHIIAHAAAGHIPHECIQKSFTANIQEVEEYSRQLYRVIKGQIGYVKGNCLHYWHGSIERREYLKRIQEFTPQTVNINIKDNNGLYKGNDSSKTYVKEYFKHREVGQSGRHEYTKPRLTERPPNKKKSKKYAPYTGTGRRVCINNHYYDSYVPDLIDELGNVITEAMYWQMFYNQNNDLSPIYIEDSHNHNENCDHNNNGTPDYQEVGVENSSDNYQNESNDSQNQNDSGNFS